MSNLACLASHCRDPCPGVCGLNAQCHVVSHVPVCTCLPGHIGDPFQSCRLEPIKRESRDNLQGLYQCIRLHLIRFTFQHQPHKIHVNRRPVVQTANVEPKVIMLFVRAYKVLSVLLRLVVLNASSALNVL